TGRSMTTGGTRGSAGGSWYSGTLVRGTLTGVRVDRSPVRGVAGSRLGEARRRRARGALRHAAAAGHARPPVGTLEALDRLAGHRAPRARRRPLRLHAARHPVAVRA